MRAACIALVLALGCGRKSESKHDAAAPKGSPFETFQDTTPKPGERAPDFELAALDGSHVRLSQALRRGPAVLVFGSFT